MAQEPGDHALAAAADGGGEEGRKDERLDSHELDEDVERGARGVLERIANGVADDGSLVAVGSFRAELAGVIRAARHIQL